MQGVGASGLIRGVIMQNWREIAERMKFDDGKSWAELAEAMKPYFPNLSDMQRREKVRDVLRRSPRYKQQKAEDFHRSSIEYKADGSIISEKFITIRDGDDMTPDYILDAHGLKPSAWEVVSYKNNLWNTQVKGGAKQISYQS